MKTVNYSENEGEIRDKIKPGREKERGERESQCTSWF